MLALGESSFALDGEIVAADFPSLMARLHPAASRVERLRHETPATLVAFDLLAVGGDDLRERPFAERRARLEQLLSDAGESVVLTPATADAERAAVWLDDYEGVIAKHESLPYLAGKRTMVKVKRERTVDCVVAGMRWLAERPLPSSLLLGLYDEHGELHHVGVTSSFAEPQRHSLLRELGPLIVPIEGHPWERGFLLGGGSTADASGTPAHFRRWRPDRDRPARLRADVLDVRRHEVART